MLFATSLVFWDLEFFNEKLNLLVALFVASFATVSLPDELLFEKLNLLFASEALFADTVFSPVDCELLFEKFNLLLASEAPFVGTVLLLADCVLWFEKLNKFLNIDV